MKLAIVLVALVAMEAGASPMREKRGYLAGSDSIFFAPVMIIGYLGVQAGKAVVNLAGSVKEFIENPVQSTKYLTEEKLHDIIGYELDVAQDNKLISDGENVRISVTFDQKWHHPNDNDLTNDQHVDWLKLNGDANAAAQYKKALKEIVALKQSGTSNIKCLYHLHGATVDFLSGNGIVSSTGGLALKKITDSLTDLKNEITSHVG